MTKKHFNAIAQRIKGAADDFRGQSSVLHGLRVAAEAFADSAAEVNPRFDYDRFMEACGLTER
jgi:hypothetical protein